MRAAERSGAAGPRTLLLTTDTVGGVWSYTVELARALGPEGIRIELAALGGPASAAQREAVATIPGVTLHESDFRLPWMHEPWDDVHVGGGWLLDLGERVGAELVHVNDPVYARLPWRVPVVAAAHSCVLSWWQAVRGEPAPRSWDRYREAMSQGLAAADAVVAPSHAMLAALRVYYGVWTGRVIPNGVDPAAYAPGVKEDVVFAAGRLWDAAKNLAALEHVAPALPCPVYVAGEARHPDGGVAPLTHVRALGRLHPQELRGWLARSAIYALPARYEPFGLSVLEAALSGCALVLGDIASLRENWSGVAVFVHPDDTDALSAATLGLLEDPELRGTLAMRARRRALAFAAGAMAHRYQDLYARLLRRRRERRPPIREASACAS